MTLCVTPSEESGKLKDVFSHRALLTEQKSNNRFVQTLNYSIEYELLTLFCGPNFLLRDQPFELVDV